MSFFLVLSTAVSEKEGRKIGETLVKKRLAACVNIIPGITSFFLWEGKPCKEKEVILLIKTTERNIKELANNIKKIHTYSVPEIVAVKIGKGDKKYLDWVESSVKKRRERGKKTY